MATVNLNIRMDSDLKEQFEAFCNDMGMSMTTAMNIFAKKVVREYRIPFEIGMERPNAATREAMQETRDILSGKVQAKRYTSFAEALKDVEKDETDESCSR